MSAIFGSRRSYGAARLRDGAAAVKALPGEVAVGLVSVLVLLPALSRPGPQMDEGIVLAYADRILHGAIPYRDFQEFYGPGNLWAVAGAFRVFGVHLGVERAVGLAYLVITVVSTYAVVRRFGRDAAVISAFAMLAVAYDGGVWAYTTRGAVALLTVSIALGSRGDAGTRLDRLRVAAAGACAGGALLYRYDFVLPIALAALALLRPLTARMRVAYLASLTATALLYAPYLVLTGAGGIGRTIREIRSVPSGRRLPIPGPVEQFDGRLLFSAAVALLLLLAAAVALRRRRDPAATALLASALACVGAVPFVLQRADATHVEAVAIVAFGLLPASIATLQHAFDPSRLVVRICTALAVFAALWGSAQLCVLLVDGDIWYAAQRELDPGATDVANRGRTFVLGSRADAADAQRVVSAVDRLAQPGDTFFAGPYDLRRAYYGPSYLYFLLPQLRPASYYMQFAPWTANRPGSRLADDIERADWLVLVSKWDSIHEPNASSRLGPALPNEIVRTRFCLVEHSGAYRLFRHRVPGRPCRASA